MTLISLVWTVTSDYGERTFTFSHVDWWLTLLQAVLLLLALTCTPLLKWVTRLGVKRMALTAGIITGLAAIVWVFAANVGVIWDSLDLWTAATSPSTPQWAAAGYMERYPYQASMILFLQACHWLAGSNALLLFQLLNTVCVGVSSWTVIRLVHSWTGDKKTAGLALLLQIMFLPPILYATFVYGNQLSVTLMLIAFLMQSRGFNTGLLRWHIGASLMMLLAVIAKQTMLIAVIALILTWIVEAIRSHKAKFLAPAALGLVLCLSIPGTVDSTVLESHDANPDMGLPKTTWVVMGLGANDQAKEPYRGLGMFDTYPFRLPVKEYTPAKQSTMDKQLIKTRLESFANNPTDMFRFFGRKTVYMWADPTHGSITASNWNRGSKPAMSEREKTRLADSMYDGRLHTLTVNMMDVIQFTVFAGFLLAFTVRRTDTSNWGLALFAFGGFLLYLAWEAKSQYTLPMVQAMLPYAAIGLMAVPRMVGKLGEKLNIVGNWVLDACNAG